ncbi:MAG: nucleotide exchange factor GrpE [Actinomycetota bacterium]|nr:nucleotide exchange factor GrpE [Actinomycetota bacterium]
MTQDGPPIPSGPGPTPDESLSARFAGRAPDQGFEDPARTMSEVGSASEVEDVPAEAPEQRASTPEDEAYVAPGAEQAGDPAGQPTVEDARSREELLAALQAAEAARDEYLEDLRRTQAEFQNFRKRTMREGALQREQGTIDVLSRLIDVVDDFELAVLAAASASEVGSLRKGVEMVYGKFVEALQAFGLEKIGQEGVPFDPQRHDAVQHVQDGEERGEPVVAEVLRPGYLVGGRVLRPAMVKVVT